MTARTVFFLSDGTGITAEAFGNAILAQFDIAVRRVRLPFVDTPEIKSFASSALFAFLRATNSSSSTTTFPTKLLTASLPLMLLSEQYHSGNNANFSIKDVFPTP